MAVGFSNTNKPLNPRGQDASPKGYNRAALYSGKALDFDGVGDYVDLDGFTLSGTTATISFALKADSWSGEKYILDAESNRFVIGTEVSDNQFAIYDSTSWKKFGEIPNPLGLNVFTLVLNNTSATLYINGVQLGLSQTITAINLSSASVFKLMSNKISSAYFFAGQLSGFKIFNTALTAAQVADLYNNPEKVVPTGVDNTALKLWLPMMEGAGTTAYDGSGNGNHGTIAGATYVNGIGAPVAQSAVISWNKGTNLVAYSEEFNQWTSNSSSVTANDTTAPDGQTTADKWIPDSGTTSANLRFNSADIATGTDYVFFCFAKAAGFDVIELDFQDSRFSDVNASFNLTSGTITATGGDNVTEGIIDKGDGWYLCYIVGNSIASGSNFCIFRQNNSTGDGSKGYYLWGAGFNQASDIVPYVRTSNVIQGSAVLLPQGLTTGRDITGVNLFENVRKQGALNLDGNSWAEVHDNASLDVTTGLSVENWIYIEDAATQGRILSKWGSSQPNRSFQMFMNNAVVRFLIGDGSSQASLNSSTSLTEGNWHHIVSTYDGANIKIYINGSADATTTETFTIYNSNEPVLIGGYIGGTILSVNPIAQPRIYNRALTASEVLRNYNSGKNTYTND